MNVADAARARRSIKRFADRAVTREEIEGLLELAALAPNHRMTEPWGYLVLGPEARRSLGRIRGNVKAAKLDDRAAAKTAGDKVARDLETLPALVAFTQRLDERPDVREEDYAAVFMGIQSFLLGAAAIGLGTHVKTGTDLDSPETRDALGVDDGERVVALVYMGEPEELPAAKRRVAASERTRWLP